MRVPPKHLNKEVEALRTGVERRVGREGVGMVAGCFCVLLLRAIFLFFKPFVVLIDRTGERIGGPTQRDAKQAAEIPSKTNTKKRSDPI